MQTTKSLKHGTKMKIIFVILLCFVVKPYESFPNTQDEVTIQAAVVLSKPGPTLALTLVNKGRKGIQVIGPFVNGFMLRIVKPNGETIESSSAYSLYPGTKIPVIQTGESKTWQIDISPYFTSMSAQFKDAGTYMVSARIYDTAPNGVKISYTSNEIPILREANGPDVKPDVN